MTHLFFLLTFWSVSLSLLAATESEISSPLIVASLKLQGFQCHNKLVDGCSYQECLGSLPGYPQPVLMLVPKKVAALRLHFHGHKLGKFPEYEKNLTSMLQAFKLNQSLCQASELAVFPESSGNCTTYDETLRDKPALENFLTELHSALGQNLKRAPLNLSAHSGGGRVLSRFLASQIPVASVSVFDGIYSESVKNILSQWYKTSEGKLVLATVKGMDPYKFTIRLKQEIGETLSSAPATFQGTSYEVSRGLRMIHFCRAAGDVGALQAHYDVMTQTWSEN
ncbi:MAG: hypothetical protein H0V66_07985 [Bdellovibrionales bacterium]|nr:hypothetical protein [Bdellovibrionales bacterium]